MFGAQQRTTQVTEDGAALTTMPPGAMLDALGALGDHGPWTREDVIDAVRRSSKTAVGVGGAIYVASTAIAVHGAWPVGLGDHYEIDEAHFRRYAELARTSDGFARYLDEFVHRRRQAAE